MENNKENKKEKVTNGKGKKVTYTCVCDNEWRGTHNNEWGDCVCYTEEQVEAEK